MPIESDKIAGSNTSEVGDTGAMIEIEHPANGTAVIRVTYPENRRRKDIKVLMIVCTILCLLPAVAWLIFHKGLAAWFAVSACAFLPVVLMTNMIRQFSAVCRSYVFRVDETGLTVETLIGQRRTMQHLSREHIADIILRFSRYGRANSLFFCWMEIQPATSFDPICCLENLGGDHLARIANVLREALGMPKRSWP